MKKLFLSSYFTGVINQFQVFMQNNAVADREILFIPTASNVEEYTDYIGEECQALSNLGYVVDKLDIASESREIVTHKFQTAKMFFFTGGNTFYLLQELKRKNLLPIINEKINAGVPYIGESAGSAIAAPSIDYITTMDDVSAAPDLTDYNALAQTGFYTLPHFGEEPFAEADEKIIAKYQDKINLVPINNSQAIISDGKNYRIV